MYMYILHIYIYINHIPFICIYQTIPIYNVIIYHHILYYTTCHTEYHVVLYIMFYHTIQAYSIISYIRPNT